MSSSQEKDELRLKIKKLKYKIDKEEKTLNDYRSFLNRFKRFDEEKLTIQRVMKKISFLLQIKGLTLTDWFGAYPYNEDLKIDTLVKTLQQLGIKLPRDEKSLLSNFLQDQFPKQLSFSNLKKFISELGIEIE